MAALCLRVSVALLIFGAVLVILAQNTARFLPGSGQIVFAESTAESLYVLDVQRGWLSMLAIHGAMPTWSPDGRFIAYAAGQRTNPDIYLFELASSTRRQLTDDFTYDGSPAWSPDGTQLAFASGRDGDYDIYVMNLEGGDLRNLTNNHDFDNNPTWSPDGRYIAFESNRTGYGVIYVMDVAAADAPARPLTDGDTWAANPAWSPDGTRIAFEYYTNNFADIYVINVDGTGLRDLTNYPEGNDLSPTWSPDSRQLAFISARRFYRQVYVIDVTANEPTPQALTLNATDKGEPAWQP